MGRAVAVIELLMLDSSVVQACSGVLAHSKALWRIAGICMRVGKEGGQQVGKVKSWDWKANNQLVSRELARSNQPLAELPRR